MIRTSDQLKAKVRQISQSDSNKAQTLIRNFVMERFLERISISSYRKNFILKGGMLVASIAGLETRATMDIDATIDSITLSESEISRIITEIINIQLEDGIIFNIISISQIMDEFEYPGIRVNIEARLDRLRQNLQLDFSTDDAITPKAIEYNYQLTLENRKIIIWAYNLETLIAEKLQTLLVRGEANTRLRDFYDLYILTDKEEISNKIDYNLLKNAFMATCSKRNFLYSRITKNTIITSIRNSNTMISIWNIYCKKSFYISKNISWNTVIDSIEQIFEKAGI